MEITTPIAIIGAGGFIGSNLIRLFDTQNIRYVKFHGDMKNRDDVESFYKQENPSLVIHLVGSFLGSFENLYEANILTTFNLLDIGKQYGLKRIIYASTGAVYGSPMHDKGSRETDTLSPNTTYGLTKMFAENCIKYFHEKNKIHYSIMRFPNVYGPGNNKGVIFEMLRSIKEKKELTIFGDGYQKRQFLHIDDACHAIFLVIKHSGSDIYNITNPKIYTINDVAKILQKSNLFKITYKPENNALTDMRLDMSYTLRKIRFSIKHLFLELD